MRKKGEGVLGESVNRRGVARKKGLGKYEREIVRGEVSFWA